MEAEANFTSKSESAPKYFPDKSGATIPLLKFHLSFATLYKAKIVTDDLILPSNYEGKGQFVHFMYI